MDRRVVYAVLAVGFTYTVTIFGGAFASGREIMQFYGRFGSWGLWGGIWGLILFAYSGLLALALAIRWKAFDYRSFVTKLFEGFLPKKVASGGEYVFEVAYLFLCILVLGIIIATGGSLFVEEFGIPYAGATAIMGIIILVIVLYGATVIRAFNFTITWVLLAAAVIIFVVAFVPIAARSHEVIISGVGPSAPSGWLWSSTVYVGYNLLGLCMLIAVGQVIATRRSAFTAGVIGGAGIGILVLLEYVICMTYYPEIVEEVLPLHYVTATAGVPIVRVAYDIILLGAVVTTGVGVIYPPVLRFVPRLTAKYGEQRKALCNILFILLLLAIGYGLSFFGLIPLVAKGFTAAGWTFIIVLGIPLFIFGSIMVWRRTDKVLGKAS